MHFLTPDTYNTHKTSWLKVRILFLTGRMFELLKCLVMFVSGCLRLLSSLILATPRARQGRVTAPPTHKISGEIEFYSKMRRKGCLQNKNGLLLRVLMHNSGSDLKWRESPRRGWWPACFPRVPTFYTSRGENTFTPSRINLFSHRDTFIVLNINAQNKIVENSF